MLEEPDLRLADLSIWVLGRQFSDLYDYWDGNWLNVGVRVESFGARVEVEGPIIHLRELVFFADELQRLDNTLTGNAALKITPDHLTQSHEFIFAIDQTYFKPLIADCRKILSAYPIRGNPHRPRA